MRMPKQKLTTDEAASLALKGLYFLASDEARLTRFLQLTGIAPDELRAQAGEEATMVAVLDHLLSDQSLLLVFAAEMPVAPERVEEARVLLTGSSSQGVWL